MSAFVVAVSGLALGLSLIVAIGSQNAFVLHQGLRGEHLAAVVAVCATSDAILIGAGVGGAGAVLERWPVLQTAVRIAGAVFLAGYGLLAARRATRSAALLADRMAPRSLTATVSTAFALTWLNPHVYLDTMVLLGSIANTYRGQQWWFAAGATCGSLVWFTALGYGARLLRPLFTRPGSWRVLDATIAGIMLTLAGCLTLSVT